MDYTDASQTGSMGNSEPIARPDVDTLAPGSFGPASGNAITGAGTSSGNSGADAAGNPPATIVEVHGAGGATSASAGAFQAVGQYGVLTMDAQGDFNYVRNPGTPDGVQDVFNYTLADASGASSSTTLTIDIGQVAAAAAGQGVVNLPAGVEMSDIHVNGRDLVINMPDGTQMVIPGGAVFVPQLTIGDVEVPPTNLAALLIGSEPQPAAGPPQSSGGNFADPVPPLDPGVPLGDLIPPTELTYTPPEFHEVNQFEDTEPTIIIITPDNPAGAVDAVDHVDESGLPARGSEPEGTLEPQNIETTTGTIVFTAQDGLENVTINDVAITQVGQQIVGDHGTLTITGIDLENGQITYSYTATDNTTQGVDDFENFTVVVTDTDGDSATGTLHINIEDDQPIARDDTDTLNADEHTATGNVMTGADTTTGQAGHDTVGADNATLTAVSGADGSDSTFDSDGNLVVHGAYGTLTIDAQGNYTYVRDEGAPDNVQDVFEYTLTDGDGSTDTATLTIIVPNLNEPPIVAGSSVHVSEEGLVGGNPDTTGTPDTTDKPTATGDIGLSDPDGDSTTVTLGVPTGTYTSGGEAVNWAVSADGHTLVGYTGSDSTTNHVIEVTINNAGEYTVNLVQPFDDPNTTIEDAISFTIPVSVNDGTVTVSTTISVTVEDDAPNAVNDTDSLSGNNASTDGNVVTGVGTTNNGTDSYGADGPGSVTGVHAGTSGSFTSVPQDGSDVTIHGTFGDLVIHDDGSYTYTRYDNAVTGGTDVFTYQLTDGDGDTDTATLTITVPNINTTPDIVSADDATVDEDGLQNANVDANPLQTDPNETDSTESATDTGSIVVDFHNDVPGNLGSAITLVDTSALDGQLQTLDGQDIVFTLESGVLVGRPAGGGDPLVEISITGVSAGPGTGQATYTYEVDLLGPVQHTDPNSEDTISLEGVTFQVTDSNGDPATGTFDVHIVDDVPTASLSDNGVPGITLDESASGTDSTDGTLPNGISTDTVDFSGAFNAPVFGADGEGSVTYGLQLTGSNVGSGLYALDPTDTDPTGGLGKGAEIMLVDNGDGTISGMVGTDEYFVISVNADTGEVTFTQELNIWHPDTGNNDDAQSIVPDGGSLNLVQTVVDGDGDTDTASVDLSGEFTIQDDGPTSVADGEPDLPQLVVDESPLSGDGVNSDHANFASAFADTIDYGTDGPGDVQYSLILGAEGAGSGLYALDPTDTDPTGGLGKGAEIQLYTENGTIVGKVGDTVYFTISVDADTGEVTLTRNPDENLWHSDTSSPDDQDILSAASGTIELQQSVIDADGDHSESTVDLSSGVFVFEDDGPAAVADTNTVTEGDTLTVVVADGVLSNDDFGTDGPGTIVGVQAGNDTSNPVSGNVGTQIDGDYGKLTLNADGSYTYESTDGAVPPAGATDTFVYTIVDADGDPSTVTLTINLDNNNLIPVAGETYATVDDEGLPNGIPGDVSNGDIDADSGESGAGVGDESVYTGTLQGTGGDTPTSFLFDAGLDGQTATVGTENIVYQVSGDGLTLTAYVDGGDRDGSVLFTVVITDAATGAYTLTLEEPVMHTYGDGTEASVTLDIPYQMNDSDVPPDQSVLPGTLHVEFNDDVPTANSAGGENHDQPLVSGLVDEDDLSIANGDNVNGNNDNAAGDDDPGNADGDNNGTTTGGAAGSLAALFNSGADTPLTYTLTDDTTSLENQNLTSNGSALVYSVDTDTGVLVGYVESGGGAGFQDGVDTTIFTLTINEDGSWTFDLSGQLDHPTAGTEDNLDIDFSGMVTAVDADGDPVTGNPNTFVVTVDDDLPVANPPGGDTHPEPLVTGLVDEDDLSISKGDNVNGNNDSADGDNDPGNADGDNNGTTTGGAAGSLDALFSAGADQPMKNFTLVDDTSGLPALTSNGHAVLYDINGGVLTAYVDLNNDTVINDGASSTVFTLTVNSDGSWTFDLSGALDHPTAGTEDNLDLDFSGIITATDADGDPVTADAGTFVVTVDDDMPVANPPGGENHDQPLVSGLVDEDDLPNGIGDTTSPGDDDPGNADGDNDGTTTGGAAGSLDVLFSVGADAPLKNFGISADTSGLPALTSNGETVLYYVNGSVLTAYVDSGANAGFQSNEDTTIFKLTVNADGSWKFDLEGQLDHPDNNPATEDNLLLDLSSAITATDADGDPATAAAGTFVISVDDDMPVKITPDTAVLDNDTGSVTGVLLDSDGDIHDNVGADQPGTARFPSTLEGANSGLTSNEAPIVYHLSGDQQTLYGYVDSGANDGFQEGEDTVIFTITLHPDSSTYDVEMSGHVDSKSFIDFNGGGYDFHGGNDPWASFGVAGNAATPDLLLTPIVNGVSDGNVQTSSILGGVNGSNDVASGESLRVDFVTNVEGNPAKTGGNTDYSDAANQDHTFDDHYNTNGAIATFSSTSPGTSDVLIKAFDDPDGNDIVGDGAQDTITAVAISFAGGVAVLVTSSGTVTVNDGLPTERTYTVTFDSDGNGGVLIEDVYGTGGAQFDGTTIGVYTADGYNSLEYAWAGGLPFKIGDFGASVETSNPVDFNVPVEIVDADGDAVAGDPIHVTINPPASASTLSALSVSNSSITTEGSKTALFPSNDNGSHRSGDAGNNAALLGAIAAAGLASSHQAAAHGADMHLTVHEANLAARADGDFASIQGVQGHDGARGSVTPVAVNDAGQQNEVVSRTPVSQTDQHTQQPTGDQHQQGAPTELLQATDAPAHTQGGPAPVAAASIAMPSAQQLAALAGHGPSEGQHNEVVGQVLADALQGGSNQGPNLEAMVNSLPGHEGGHAALEAMTSQHEGGVPMGHMSAFAAFGAAHSMLMADAMVVHQDAPPAHG